MTLRLRDLTDDERTEIQRITRSHTLGAAFVRRAQIVVHAMSGLKAEEIASRMDLCGNTVRYWINRFNARGLDGLEEDVRTGRPPTYSAEQRSAVITAVLTRPTELGLPFACWTLDRLVAYLSGQGIAMRRSRISEIFIREGLKWRHEETWFGERVDPDFAKKGGHRTALHRAADGQRSGLPGRDGAAGGTELSRPAARETGSAQGRTGQTGDRLRPAGQRLRFRGLPAGQRRRPYSPL
jgi:transposase